MIALLVAIAASAPAQLPPDVQRFIDRRDWCDHWRGEEPYDAPRAREIERAVARDCAGTDRALAGLKRGHAGQPAVQAALARFEIRIEGHATHSTRRKSHG